VAYSIRTIGALNILRTATVRACGIYKKGKYDGDEPVSKKIRSDLLSGILRASFV
jgi:hypothetical protein